jgi:hypothetical protein
MLRSDFDKKLEKALAMIYELINSPESHQSLALRVLEAVGLLKPLEQRVSRTPDELALAATVLAMAGSDVLNGPIGPMVSFLRARALEEGAWECHLEISKYRTD